MNQKVPNPSRVASLYLAMQTGERQLSTEEMAELDAWARAGSEDRLKMLQDPIEKFSDDINAAFEKDQSAFLEIQGNTNTTPQEIESFDLLQGGNEQQVKLRVLQAIFGEAETKGPNENVDNDQQGLVVVTKRKSIFRKENWGWMVAASVLGVALAVVLFTSRNNSPSLYSYTKKNGQDSVYKPGMGRAMLTNGDGQQIELGKVGLDTVIGGSIVQSDSFSIKYKNIHQESPSLNTLTTSLGGMFQAILPDGTLVWLNAGSRLQYPTYFSGDQRGVSLIGEAYFEVAKDAKKPFVVKTSEFSVEVKGTHFNIRAYKEDQQKRTTLIEGSVVVTSGSRSVVLEPGEAARVFRETRDFIRKDKADIDNDLAWKNGEFYFRRTPIREALREIGEWYNINIEFLEAENTLVNMVIARSEPMEKVLQTLMLSTGYNYTIEHSSVKVRAKNQ